jgi:hypothetical protein
MKGVCPFRRKTCMTKKIGLKRIINELLNSNFVTLKISHSTDLMLTMYCTSF